MQTKKIVDKRLPFYLIPFRYLYRQFSRRIFKSIRLFQVERGAIKYLLWANEDIGKRMIFQGKYESNELLAFGRLIRKGDVCIDVGGNVGIFSLNFARYCGELGSVYVFEPLRKNQLVIELAVEINGLRNVSIFPYALSNSDGEVVLEIPSIDGAYAFMRLADENNESRPLTVRCLPLDGFIREQNIQRVDILKIDVEGAEKLVLDGGLELLRDPSRRPRVIMVELVDEFLARYGATVSEVLSMMHEIGYEAFWANNSGDLKMFSGKDINKIFNVFFVCSQS